MKRIRSTKRHKGRVSNIPRIAPQGNPSSKGEYGLISTTSGRVTAKQLTSLTMSLKRKMLESGKATPKGTQIVLTVDAVYPVTSKPLEVRMGKGKGSITEKIARIRPNTRILYIPENVVGIDYKDILEKVGNKLPVGTRVKYKPGVISPTKE